MKLFILGLLLTSVANAWTLNNNFGASFKKNDVKVYVDESTTCANNSLTVDELKSMIKPAVNKYWNTIPTSNLNLKAAGFSSATQNINDGRLCSPTDDTCITAAENAGILIPAVTDIVIACNDLALNFGHEDVLAVTIPNRFSGKKIVGAIILINEAWNPGKFGQLTKSDQIAVIAHEIGHALGLGHSEEKAALMFYRIVDQRKKLGQDDIDAITYLYPINGDIFGLSEDGVVSCGTITDDKKNPPGNPPFLQMGIAFGLMILLFELYRLFNRTKARPAT